MRKHLSAPRRARGFVLAYVLFAIALISLSIAALSRANTASDAGRKQAEVRDDLVQQAELIRAKLIACSLNYPAGDNGLGFRLAFPARPTSGEVPDLQCPGAPIGQTSLWLGNDGIYAPKRLVGLSTWQYAHDATSMRISISITSSTPYLTAGMNGAALKFGAQATVSDGVLTITLAG